MAKNQFISNSRIDVVSEARKYVRRLRTALAVLGILIFLLAFVAIALPFLLWACVPYVGCLS